MHRGHGCLHRAVHGCLVLLELLILGKAGMISRVRVRGRVRVKVRVRSRQLVGSGIGSLRLG